MKDKVVIVTGSSSGIGLAISRGFAMRGARVVIAARTVQKLEDLAHEITSGGGSCLAIQTDVTREEDCKRLVNETIRLFGRIDILVNNAGISMRARFDTLDLSVIKRLMDVNFWGTVYCTKYALPYLLQSRGALVGVSSAAGFHGLPGRTGYSASKYAIHGFLETLRIEYRKNGLHVMIICPGFTSSNIRIAALTADGSPQGESPRKEERMMSAEKVARHLVRGIKRRKRMVVLGLEGKLSFLMKKFSPALLDRLSYNAMLREPDSPLD